MQTSLYIWRKMSFQFPLTLLSRFVFAFAFIVAILGINPSLAAHAQDSKQVKLEQFDMLTTTSGWILLDQRLFWTSDAGETWKEIGPSLSPYGSIQDVKFMDSNIGWILWTSVNSDGGTSFQLARTIDQGMTWATHSLSLFAPGDIASSVKKAQMGWLDAQTGWISIKQESSSNFSIGSLFISSNGGDSWNRSPLPVADKIVFAGSQTGWAVGGSTGDQVFDTQDAGKTWKNSRPADLPEGIQTVVYPPFVSDKEGLLVTTTMGEENGLNVYSLNPSNRWIQIDNEKLDIEPGIIGLSILDAQSFMATIPSTKSIVRMVNGQLNTFENMDGLSASIAELDMVSLDIGWAKSIDSTCATEVISNNEFAPASCTSTVRLLQTTNGGISWIGIELPLIQSDKISMNFTIPEGTNSAGLQNTEIFIGQGFDRCEIPSLSQMQTWWIASPYKAVNLYIGGSSRACENNALISSYLFLLNQQGWKFFPTWVGPQAPCNGFSSRISSDVATAYGQGVAQANLAVERLAALGLTGPDKTGSVIYYDIEAYGTNQACRNAVNSFMDGWVSHIHARGNLSGVYGSTLCDTGLSDFLTISNVPDVMWAARWYHNLGYGYYDPNATVWNLGSCIPNSMWANHQRIRQYEGDHDETWGNLTLNIDSNVLDSAVAVPYDYPYVSTIVRTDPNPTNADMVGFTVNFSKLVTGVDQTDFRLTTAGVIGASIMNVSGSGTTYTVTVNTGSGKGTIRLDVVDNDSIKDESNNPLGGTGASNGSYVSGERYNIVIGADTVGVFRPSNGALYLKNSNTTGYADIAINYGMGGDYPVVGDWDGNGTDTIGVYRNGVFYLRNSNTVGVADVYFAFGSPGDQPITGDWNGDGIDTIGVYRNGTFYLRNSNTAGTPQISFALGMPGDVGIAGDWDGDGTDTTGVFRPSNGVIFLKNANTTGVADIGINYGIGGDKPVTGDWNNDGIDTIGVLRGNTFYLRNSNTVGNADMWFALGIPGDMPIAGNWDGIP